MRIPVLLAVLALAGCGLVKPGTPGHEPPSGGNINPISHTRSGGD